MVFEYVNEILSVVFVNLFVTFGTPVNSDSLVHENVDYEKAPLSESIREQLLIRYTVWV